MDKVTAVYPDPRPESGCGIDDRSKIQCNPAIFGFKKAESQSLFCVTASDGAHNSAYNCMKEATESTSSTEVDSAEDRLKFLRENLAANPEIFNGVQNFIYKTCICAPSEDVSNPINNKYHNYIRPHRTCYGMMNMIAKTSICEDPRLPIDTSILEALTNHAREKIPENSLGSVIDHEYSQFINVEVKKTATSEYNRLCEAKEPLPVKPAPEADAKVYQCSQAVCTAKAVTPVEGEADSTTTEGAEESYPGPGYDCAFTVTEKDKDKPVTFDKTPEFTDPSADQEALEISGSIATKEVTLSCPLQFAVATDEKEVDKDEGKERPSLEVTIASKRATEYDVKAKITNKSEGWTLKWSIEDKGGLTISEGWKKEKAEPKKTELKVAGTFAPKEVESETPAEAGGDDEVTIIQKRYTKNYKVCGQLIKVEEKIPETPLCVVIDMLPTAIPSGTQNNFGPGGQQFPRKDSSTAAGGIR
jgi:hypothetical protein